MNYIPLPFLNFSLIERKKRSSLLAVALSPLNPWIKKCNSTLRSRKTWKLMYEPSNFQPVPQADLSSVQRDVTRILINFYYSWLMKLNPVQTASQAIRPTASLITKLSITPVPWPPGMMFKWKFMQTYLAHFHLFRLSCHNDSLHPLKQGAS